MNLGAGLFIITEAGFITTETGAGRLTHITVEIVGGIRRMLFSFTFRRHMVSRFVGIRDPTITRADAIQDQTRRLRRLPTQRRARRQRHMNRRETRDCCQHLMNLPILRVAVVTRKKNL